MIMIFWCGVFESIAEDCGFKNKVLDILKLLHVIRNFMEMDSGRNTLLKYKYIQFNQPTSQVVLNPGDILVVNTNWWFHETKVLQESLNSNALFGFKPRCFLENSVSQ